jgi:two-component system, NarL family, nitrate/nitrite response regulator NarL
MSARDFNKINLMLVDDHQIMMDGIKALLKNERAFCIIAETTKPLTVLDLIGKKMPDIIIADISMPELNGVELTKLIKQKYPEVKVLALSMHNDKQTITEMLQAGISGFVLKNTGKKELIDALEKIADGGMYFSEAISLEIMRSTASSNAAIETSLTPREIEIVKLIGAELNNAQIGDKLFISERTVETHRKNIFRKINVKSVAGLMKYALEKGIV